MEESMRPSQQSVV